MGRVIKLKQNPRKLPKEGSEAEEILVSELYKKLQAITGKYHDVVVCKAVAVMMGTLMVKTETPGMVIGGFMKHIQVVANIAIAQHKSKEKDNAGKVYGTKHPEGGQANGTPTGHAGPQDPDSSEGSDRNLEEQEGQEVLLPPTLQ